MVHEKILIVEDEVIVSTDLRTKINRLGYEVVDIVRYGEKVLEKAQQHDPDLVLMDINLKGSMDGIQAAEQLKNGLAVPVIFLTAFSDEDILNRAKETEPYAYLRKPVKLDDLRISLQVALHKAKIDRKLRESETRFRTVADFAYDWETWRDTDGQYLHMSPSCKRITGYERDHFYNDPLLLEKIVHPEDRDKFREHLDQCDNVDMGVCKVEFRILHREGDERWVEHICRPVYTEAGDYLGRRASNRDITCRKSIELEREKLIDELQKAQKDIRTLSGLLPICSHCKKIRDDQGYWNELEMYITKHSDVQFSHSLCHPCMKQLYPGLNIFNEDDPE